MINNTINHLRHRFIVRNARLDEGASLNRPIEKALIVESGVDESGLATLSAYALVLFSYRIGYEHIALEESSPDDLLGGASRRRTLADLSAHISHHILGFERAMELQIRNLSKTYANNVHALKDITLTIPRGMFGLLGPNGAGKSILKVCHVLLMALLLES